MDSNDEEIIEKKKNGMTHRSSLSTLVLLISTLLCEAFTRPALVSGSCSFSFIRSMRAYDCAGLNLSEIPQHLQSSTEVMDASMNRLRELHSGSLRKYSSLKILYLNDNMIMSIHPNTFEKLTSLHTLDLSMNALINVPPQIFHMPSLEDLSLSKNPHLDIFGLINNSLPITAPIKHLDISYCPLLTQLPDMTSFLDLVHLNISGNVVKDIVLANFIGLCNLRYFSTENSTLEFGDSCSCKHIETWFDQTDVKSVPPFYHRCMLIEHECFEDSELLSDASVRHQTCRSEYQARVTQRSVLKVFYIVLAVIGGALLFVAICFIYYKTQKLPDIEPKKNNEKTEALLTPNNNSA